MTQTYESAIKKALDKRNVTIMTIALSILVLSATFIFGYQVLIIAAVSLGAAFVVEMMFHKGRKIDFDGAWMIYPLLFTLLIPSTLELKYLWMVAVGSSFGSFFGKGIFGGSGKYVFNPALVGLLFVTVSFPAFFPTMLVDVREVGLNYTILDMFLGNTPGALGETFRLGILVLGIGLMALKVIDWKIPVTIIYSVFMITVIGGMIDPSLFPNAYNSMLVGNILFVSFFIAADHTTAPIHHWGKVIYGVGIAALTVLIRYFATYPEGTMFAIILMSAVAPLIDNMFNQRKPKKEGKHMNKNLKLIIFIVIVGVVTSGLLLGADALTKSRIELNREAKLKSAVLDGFGIEYTFSNIHDIYDQDVEIITEGDLTFYVDQNSGRVSYEFEGSGLWGEIIGLITLEDDFVTIARITILQQNETPGLGGVVAERPYLDKFVGKKMTPKLEITKTGTNLDNEVDTITGATQTSTAFGLILNASYNEHRAVWETLHRSDELKSAVLDGFGITYDSATVHDIFDQKVEIVADSGLTFYVDQTTRSVSYQFEGAGRNGQIVGLITLNADFETIERITILAHVETPALGAVVAERAYLDKFVGKKMTPNIDITSTGTNLDNEVDAITGATETSDAFELMLNSSYTEHKDVWETANKEMILKSAVLDGFGITYNNTNIYDLFDQNVEVITDSGATFYVHDSSGKVAYQFEGAGRNGKIVGLITLNADFETISRITILEHVETPGLGGVVAERTYLNKFVGKKMTPSIVITSTGTDLDNEVDAIAGATQTSDAFELMLNTTYIPHKATWTSLND